MEDFKRFCFLSVASERCSGFDLSATHRVFPTVACATFYLQEICLFFSSCFILSSLIVFLFSVNEFVRDGDFPCLCGRVLIGCNE